MATQQINKYDERHDVLHVFMGDQHNAFADEEVPGIYVNRDEDSNEIVGFTILDYSKKRATAKEKFPNIDFPMLHTGT